MTAAGGAAFTAAVRMVDRVHGDAAVVRLAAEPAIATGLADRDIHVVRIGDRADGGGAAAVNQALLAGIEADDDVVMVAAAELGGGGGGGARFSIFISQLVKVGAGRLVAEGHDVTRLYVDIVAGDHGVADGKTL